MRGYSRAPLTFTPRVEHEVWVIAVLVVNFHLTSEQIEELPIVV